MNLPTKAVAAALVAASFATIATPADAQWGWRRGWGGVGIGLAAGAIIGGAIAASSYNYGYYGYPYRQAYYGGYGYGGYGGYAPTYAYYPANYGYGYASYGYNSGYYGGGYAVAPAGYYYGGYPRVRAAVRRAYWRW
jgi:hypothetical protein